MDIDETVLDNSQYEKQELLACSSYNAKTMYAFMEQTSSPATPVHIIPLAPFKKWAVK